MTALRAPVGAGIATAVRLRRTQPLQYRSMTPPDCGTGDTMTVKTDRCWCGRFMRWGGALSASGGQSGKCGRCTILHDARTGWNANGMVRNWAR